MGNSNLSADAQSRYTQLRIEENELLSNLIIVEDRHTREMLMIKQMSLANEIEYLRILKDMRLRKMASERKIGKYLIQIRDIQTKESNQICGKNYKIILYLEYLENTLKNVYNQRKANALPFSEEQIMSILRTLVNNLIILHDNNYKNIHLYKETIMMTPQGFLKIMDTQLSNKIHPYYELLNGVPTKIGTYLAPELLKEVRSKNTDFYQTPKADIFTLALIVLELCSFTSYDIYYDFDQMTVDLQGLRQAVQRINYSSQLKCILQMMLVQEQQERIGLITLKQLLMNNQMKTSQQSSTFKTISTNPKKNTTRTFISRSKPQSKISKESSLQKINNQFRQASISKNQFSASQLRQDQGNYTSHREVYDNRQRSIDANSKRSMTSNLIVYRPIEPIVVHQNVQTFPNYEVKQTPRSSFNYEQRSNLTNRFRMKEFQTPVNMLYQNHLPQPQSTPIRKVEVLSSAQQQAIPPVDYFKTRSYGQHVFSNRAKYQGQFNANNQFDGNGMLYYPSGKLCYSGSWQSNSFHGFGVLYNETPTNTTQPSNYQNFNFVDKNNWDYYQGEFDNDKKEGFGTLYMANGDKFSGCFKNDSIEGFGTFYLSNENRIVNGIWVQNILKK